MYILIILNKRQFCYYYPNKAFLKFILLKVLFLKILPNINSFYKRNFFNKKSFYSKLLLEKVTLAIVLLPQPPN